MDFQQVVEQAKKGREQVQQSTMPWCPPILHCLRGGNYAGTVISKKTGDQALIDMLGLLPATRADEVMMAVEAYVRSAEVETELPIVDDPTASKALVILHVTPIETEVSVNPFSVGDQGELVWSLPGGFTAPIVDALVPSIRDMLDFPVEDVKVRTEAVDWLAMNGYSVQVRRDALEAE